MRNKYSLLLFFLILSNDIVYGKHRNKTKEKTEQRKQGLLNSKINNGRIKRSLNDDKNVQKGDLEKYYSDPKLDKDPPFWGTRGRRDSSEEFDDNLPSSKNFNYDGYYHKFIKPSNSFKREDEDESPFWGNRGRRSSDESEELLFNSDDSSNKERKQDNDPFWGTRGRREYIESKGRLKNYILNTDDSPFRGNRGRRQESEPFWGNRGRREMEPFWGSRGKKKQSNHMILNDETEPFWGNRGRRRLKNSLMNRVMDNMDVLVGQSRGEDIFGKRGIKNRYLVTRLLTNKKPSTPFKITKLTGNELVAKKSDHNTVHDDRIFAEEPHYIIVERSSRSSAESDPFFIARGKKYSNFNFIKAIPSRRDAMEDLVQSVRNDPYYIARGKKDSENANVTSSGDSNSDNKNLFCFVVDQILSKNKVKRDETASNDRDRRTILKDLALQLQKDPYYVSRGKKDIIAKEIFDNQEKIIDYIIAECN